jgi:hypothetical protein
LAPFFKQIVRVTIVFLPLLILFAWRIRVPLHIASSTKRKLTCGRRTD